MLDAGQGAALPDNCKSVSRSGRKFATSSRRGRQRRSRAAGPQAAAEKRPTDGVVTVVGA